MDGVRAIKRNILEKLQVGGDSESLGYLGNDIIYSNLHNKFTIFR